MPSFRSEMDELAQLVAVRTRRPAGSHRVHPVSDDGGRDGRRETIGEARASGGAGYPDDGPTHPRLAATLLMVGVVVLLFAVALASSI